MDSASYLFSSSRNGFSIVFSSYRGASACETTSLNLVMRSDLVFISADFGVTAAENTALTIFPSFLNLRYIRNPFYSVTICGLLPHGLIYTKAITEFRLPSLFGGGFPTMCSCGSGFVFNIAFSLVC